MSEQENKPKRRKRRTPFLKSKILFWVLLVLCFPLALFILWRYKPYEYLGRSVITVLTSFILFSLPFGYYYYQEYQAVADRQAAEQAVIDSDPLYGYMNDGVNVNQASFLKYYDKMTEEINDYNALSGSVENLLDLVRTNNNVNVGVMAAHMDSYIERLDKSIENVSEIGLDTFSAENQEAFAKEKKAYLDILNDTADAYDTLRKAITNDSSELFRIAQAKLKESDSRVASFRNGLKNDALRMQISLHTRKPLEGSQPFIASSNGAKAAVKNVDTFANAIISIRPAMPQTSSSGANGAGSNLAATLAGSSLGQMTLEINGTKIEGDIISLY
jgi:hypothetical protein